MADDSKRYQDLNLHITWRLPWNDGTGNCAGPDVSNAEFYQKSNEERGGKAKYNALSREARAKKICEGCPLFEPCQEHGLRHELHGIWGGLSAKERITIRRRKKITLIPMGEDYFNWLKSRMNQ